MGPKYTSELSYDFSNAKAIESLKTNEKIPLKFVKIIVILG